MAIEIEIKAHALNPGEVRVRMEEKALFRKAFEKKDAYWAKSSPETGALPQLWVRLREENAANEGNAQSAEKNKASHALTVTFKKKEIVDSMEINEEKEFSVNGRAEFEEFLKIHGFKKQREKQKKGFSYDYGGINAELCEISGLGWFAELEIIAPDREEKTINEARSRLFTFLAELGIGKEALEERPYADLLKNRENTGII